MEKSCTLSAGVSSTRGARDGLCRRVSAARSVIVSISIAQVRQHGWPRCLVGGGTMYLSLPAFIVLNLTLVVVLLQGVLAPLFGVPRVRWRDHVFLDRGRIAHLFWLDRLNCQFCGYANGLTTMLNTQLDHVAAAPAPLAGWRLALAGVAGVVSAPLWVAFDLYTVRFLFGLVISRCLRMHRFSLGEGAALLAAGDYAAQYPAPLRAMLRAWKNSALALSLLLEQIESAWCPLRHSASHEGVVFPEHHATFFGAAHVEQLREARRFLHAHGGTVSRRGLAGTADRPAATER